jgi:acetylornithine/succinyldiaminopimelate/putrescine aminotransferase/predicted amino acid dehydrogenase
MDALRDAPISTDPPARFAESLGNGSDTQTGPHIGPDADFGDGEAAISGYAEHTRPLPAELLRMLGLDKRYSRARGDHLYYRERGREVEVLDLAGGYGSLILGHNHPELRRLAIDQYRREMPTHAQMSIRGEAGLLCRDLDTELHAATGRHFVITLANSGAEAVEAAAKHARMALSERLDSFLEQVERQLARIRAAHIDAARRGVALELRLDGRDFADFESFRAAVLARNDAKLAAAGTRFLAARGAFHGKTMGALALTHKPLFRDPFLRGPAETLFFDWRVLAGDGAGAGAGNGNCDPATARALFAAGEFTLTLPGLGADGRAACHEETFNAIAALFIEPIMGEAGAIPVPIGAATELIAQARAAGVPVVVDEIQCGFYRTGTLLASSQMGLSGDYYLLGKSLGGGLAKIAACATTREAYLPRFGLLHTSTYVEDDPSCGIARKALEIARGLGDAVHLRGARLRIGFEELRARYPDLIHEIRGEGLMLGVAFAELRLRQSYGLQLLARSGYMGYVLAGYLLHEHRIRIAPALAASTVIRIQPSAFLDFAEIDRALAAFDALCRILANEDLYKLVEFTLPENRRGLRGLMDFRQGEVPMDPPPEGTPRVGFLTHYIDHANLVIADPSLAVLDMDTVEDLLTRMLPVTEPIVLGRRTITASHGGQASVMFVGLPVTSGMIRRALLDQDEGDLRDLCHRGVATLRDTFGCSVIGLGQYTSILTRNGQSVPDAGTIITTGNSFTVHIGVQAVLAQARERGWDTRDLTIGIVGAGGNICTAYAQCFTRHAGRLLLYGGDHPRGARKAERAADTVLRQTLDDLASGAEPRSAFERAVAEAAPTAVAVDDVQGRPWPRFQRHWRRAGAPPALEVVETLDALRDCDLLVVATNAAEPFLGPEHCKTGAIVYDISVPANCRDDLFDNDRDITVLLGGEVALPNAESLPPKGMRLGPGLAYACMSDAILLGLEQGHPSCSYGNIQPHQVDAMGALGDKHGFRLAGGKRNRIF